MTEMLLDSPHGWKADFRKKRCLHAGVWCERGTIGTRGAAVDVGVCARSLRSNIHVPIARHRRRRGETRDADGRGVRGAGRSARRRRCLRSAPCSARSRLASRAGDRGWVARVPRACSRACRGCGWDCAPGRRRPGGALRLACERGSVSRVELILRVTAPARCPRCACAAWGLGRALAAGACGA